MHENELPRWEVLYRGGPHGILSKRVTLSTGSTGASLTLSEQPGRSAWTAKLSMANKTGSYSAVFRLSPSKDEPDPWPEMQAAAEAEARKALMELSAMAKNTALTFDC